MSNFQSILSKKADDIEKPVPMPVGTYLAVSNAQPEFKSIGKNETPAAEFTLTLIAPQDDVDPEEFEEFGGAAKLKGKTVRYTMWISEDAQYRAKETLANAFGIETKNKSLGEMFSETQGVQLLAKIGHRPSKDGTEMYPEVQQIIAA